MGTDKWDWDSRSDRFLMPPIAFIFFEIVFRCNTSKYTVDKIINIVYNYIKIKNGVIKND